MFWIIFALHVCDRIHPVFQDMNYHADEAQVSKTYVSNYSLGITVLSIFF